MVARHPQRSEGSLAVTPRHTAQNRRLSPFSIFTFPFPAAARGPFSAISNRHSPELETMSNPYKTKAGDAL